MKITVTQDDIDRGVMKSPEKCALSVAVKRQTKLTQPWIVNGHLYHGLFQECSSIPLPKPAVWFYQDFDVGRVSWHAIPFEFDIDIPEEYQP